MSYYRSYVRLKKKARSSWKRTKTFRQAIGKAVDWLRGRASKPKTKKVFAYELLEKDVMKSPGDIFYLPGKKNVEARVLSKKYQLLVSGRKSHDMIIIEYAAKGVKLETIVVDAKAELRMRVKQPNKAKLMPVYNWLTKLSKKLEVKPEF